MTYSSKQILEDHGGAIPNLLTCIDRCIVGDDVRLQVLRAQCQPQSKGDKMNNPQVFINVVKDKLHSLIIEFPTSYGC